MPLRLAILAVVLLPSLCLAQERRPSIAVGDHVRHYTASGDTLRAEGRVARLEPGRIFLAPGEGGAMLDLALEWNDLLAVRRPIPAGRSALRRGLWGAFLGGSAGGIIAPFVMRSEDRSSPADRSVLIGVGAGSLVGAGIGALLGAILPGHRWEYVRVEYELTGIPRVGQ
jgi:hypothetical protein